MKINYDCINITVPKGVFGGAMCMCPKCCERREQEQKLIQDRQFAEAISGAD